MILPVGRSSSLLAQGTLAGGIIHSFHGHVTAPSQGPTRSLERAHWMI